MVRFHPSAQQQGTLPKCMPTRTCCRRDRRCSMLGGLNGTIDHKAEWNCCYIIDVGRDNGD